MKGCYAGSFDPITNGHLWMIQQGALLFEELIVAIGVNPAKKTMFSIPERRQMIEQAVDGLHLTSNVLVSQFENLYLVRYAQQIGATHILRGVRSVADFEFERGMRNINHDLWSDCNTVFLIPPRDLAEVSSSFVKGLVGPNGWQDVVRKYVPENVFQEIERKHSGL